MIFKTATFTFDLTPGVLADLSGCTTGQTCISNVQFGFGPDGPDTDDVTGGVFCGDFGGGGTGEAVPEPVSLILLGSGLGFVGLLGLRRRKSN